MQFDGSATFIGLPSPTAPRQGHGASPCQGLYHVPAGVRPKVAMIATHYNVDFMEHYLAPYAVARGYGFLGWNTRYRGAEDMFLLEHALIDIGVGVRWLREAAGVERVVLVGNSGGGSLMAAYQGEATAPTMAAGSDLVRLNAAGQEALAGLPRGDAFVALNAHGGRPEVMTAWMDASVIDETDPVPTDESLNPFNPDNGPPYSTVFAARYRQAQTARNHRIPAWVKGELARLRAAGAPDRIFPLFRMWADLRFVDPAIDPSDRKPNLCYRGPPAQANRHPSIGRASTLTAWLSMWSLETSRCQAAEHLAKFDVPALVVQSLADTGVFPSDARKIFDQIAGADKVLHMVPGEHYFENSEADRRNAAMLVCDWVEQKLGR